MSDIDKRVNDPMPVFVLKAKDLLALEAIWQYRSECEAHRLHDQANEVLKAINEFEEWRSRNLGLLKMPDHEHVSVSEDHK